MESFIVFVFVWWAGMSGVFLGYDIDSNDLKKMNTSISNLRELKKECELHLPRTQQCKITFTGDL